MANWSYRGGTSVTGGGVTGQMVITVPTGTVDGDLLIIMHGRGSTVFSTSVTGSATWTTGSLFNSTNAKMRTWYKIASSEPASYNVDYSTGTANASHAVTMDCYKNVGAFSASAAIAGLSATTNTGPTGSLQWYGYWVSATISGSTPTADPATTQRQRVWGGGQSGTMITADEALTGTPSARTITGVTQTSGFSTAGWMLFGDGTAPAPSSGDTWGYIG